ncbi:hypothetical protein U1Q18_022068 [Sarracenia purpurea var. burkii]
MPCLPGIRLLSKIMSSESCKNIPVIMMSSDDSMGIVFKCFSKGAVDFLVKPIRKNELKNLWQHVWRKCHSSSGSGSESGVRIQQSMKSKSIEGSDNNMGSNDEDDDASTGLNVRDGSDNGSGTQSPWTKQAAEFDSAQPRLPWDQLADLDSNCAPVVHSRPEAFSNSWAPPKATRKYHGLNDEHDNASMGRDLEIGIPRNPDLQLEGQGQKGLETITGTNTEKTSDLESKEDREKFEKEKLKLNCETWNGELREEAANLIGAMADCTNLQMENVSIEVPIDISKTNNKDKAIYDSKEMPYLELSLKRLRDVGEIGTSAEEQNILRHSDLSAFSRYNTSTANQTLTGNVGSCSSIDNSSEAAKMESMHYLQSNSNGTPNQHSNGSSNNNDMGSIFQLVKNGHVSSHKSVMPNEAEAETENTVSAQGSGKHPQVQVQHHHHHYHHYHHHTHNMQQQQQQQQQQPPNHDGLSSRMPNEGNVANYSLNGSASESNNGSNVENGSSGQNGSNTVIVTEGANMASDGGLAGKSGASAAADAAGSGGSGSRSCVDQNRSAQREAALNKFRQKRKERCFDKKVRYQSRKRLAEQRPRVRGQFVRQVMYETISNYNDC